MFYVLHLTRLKHVINFALFVVRLSRLHSLLIVAQARDLDMQMKILNLNYSFRGL